MVWHRVNMRSAAIAIARLVLIPDLNFFVITARIAILRAKVADSRAFAGGEGQFVLSPSSGPREVLLVCGRKQK